MSHFDQRGKFPDRMRVLLVEDNRDTLAMIAAILRLEEYEVVTAGDGYTALELARIEPPDIALLDIGLPGMDGYELARALRALLAGRKLYIAAITGYASAGDKQRAIAAGIDAHLTKPAHPFTVIKLLEDFESRFAEC